MIVSVLLAALLTGDSMSIGDVPIALGMPQFELAEKLVKYDVRKGTNWWWINEKRARWWYLLGTVGFANGKVCSVTRTWEPPAEKPPDLMKTVIAVIREQGEGFAMISGRAYEAPDHSSVSVSLAFIKSGRTVTLTWLEAPPPDSVRRMAYVQIEETIGSCGDLPRAEQRKPQ